MQIRIRETGAVVFDNEFRSMHPNTGFPVPLTEAIINEFGGDVVFEGPQASPTRYQVGFADGVEQVNGKWYAKYSVAEMEQEAKDALDAKQAASVRQQRDSKLAATDWRYRRDLTTTPEWDVYCQALRDVPSQAGFPWEVEWPTQPE
jgi:hypothetical protein